MEDRICQVCDQNAVENEYISCCIFRYMMIWEELYSSSQKEEILDLEQWRRQKNSILFWKMKKDMCKIYIKYNV